MKKTIALILSFTMMLALFSGCTQQANDGLNGTLDGQEIPTAGDSGNQQDGDPETSGGEDVVKVVLEDALSTLNIHKRIAALEHWGLEPLNGFLVTYTEKMEIEPYLAESWDVISDTEISFKLNAATFHNGDPVTADDVKFTVDYVKNETNGCVLRTDAAAIKEIRVTSDTEFTIVLEQAFPRIFELLSNMAIISEKTAGTLDTQPIGCGPFRFVEWDQNQYLKLEKYDGFWDTSKPACDKLEFYFIPEYNTARTALLAGDVDVILYADPNDIDALMGFEDVTTYSKAITGAQWLGFRCDEAPFDDVRVRQAVNYAVDRIGIIEPIYNGNGTVLYSYFDNTPYEVGDFKVERNIEKAKELLTEAGYPDGITIKFSVPNTATEGPMGELIATQLAEAGINCEIEMTDVTTFLDQCFNKQDFQMMICGDTGAGDPDYPTYNYTVTGANNAIFGWSNTEYDRLMNEGRSFYTVDERMEYYDGAFKILADELPWIILCIENRTAALRTDIEGFVMKANLRYDFTGIHHI